MFFGAATIKKAIAYSPILLNQSTQVVNLSTIAFGKLCTKIQRYQVDDGVY